MKEWVPSVGMRSTHEAVGFVRGPRPRTTGVIVTAIAGIDIRISQDFDRYIIRSGAVLYYLDADPLERRTFLRKREVRRYNTCQKGRIPLGY